MAEKRGKANKKTNKKWEEKWEERLICAVTLRPELFDKSLVDFKDKMVRERKWEEVSAALDNGKTG